MVLLAGLGRPGLFDPNEGLYAEVGLEMWQRGDWVTPRFNGVPYFEKPPLLYWLVATSYAVFGVSEWAARLPVALASILTVLLTADTGRVLFGRRAGLLAGVALATSAGTFILLRNLKTDPIFVACFTGTLWAFVRARTVPAPVGRGRRRWPDLPLYVLAGLGVLAKGLIGVILPALAIAGAAVLARDPGALRRMRLGPGALVMAAVAAPWYVAVSLANPGFFWFFFVNEHILRFLNERHLTDYAPQPLWLFLLMAAVWALPWSLFLGGPWRWGRTEGWAWLVPCWLLAVLGFFALTPARLEYYSLPALPAWALWSGRVWSDAMNAPSRGRRLGWAAGGLAAVGLGLTLAAVVGLRGSWPGFSRVFDAFDSYSRDIEHGILAPPGSYTVPAGPDLLRGALLAGLLFLLGGLAAVLVLRRGRPGVAFGCVAVAMLGVLPAIYHGTVLFEPHRSARAVGLALAQVRRPGDVVIVDGPYENVASLNVYAPGGALVLDGRFGDLEFGSHRPGAAERFLGTPVFERVWASDNRVFLVTGSAGRAETALRRDGAVLLVRSGRRWLIANHR